MDINNDKNAFPHLTDQERTKILPYGEILYLSDGEEILRAGEVDAAMYIVEEGILEIRNPLDKDIIVAEHSVGQFSGDIDLLTQRPIIVSGKARGKTTLLKIPGSKVREILTLIPSVSEKFLTAFLKRRELLSSESRVGLKVIGEKECPDTNIVREFLHKNFVPFTWLDVDCQDAKEVLAIAKSKGKTPVIELSNKKLLINPSLQDLARATGIWKQCPEELYDLAIIGAGPAGISAGVYASSEGLKTIIIDAMGPGGQAGGSSKIENFIGFPSGLSGTELATRGVLQLLKFGAYIAAPVRVEKIDPSFDRSSSHKLHLDCGGIVEARTLFIATGVNWRRLPAKNSDRFERSGVYYSCTTVEERSCINTDVAVVGGGNSAGQAAMYLAESCSRQVHLIVRAETINSSMSDYLVDRIAANSQITIHNNSEITSIIGESEISAITILNKVNSEEKTISCGGVFVFIGAVPQTEWMPQKIFKDKKGFILTGVQLLKSNSWPLKDREPCPLETSIPGILAGGDVRSGATNRVGFAVGEGSLAISCVHSLLQL